MQSPRKEDIEKFPSKVSSTMPLELVIEVPGHPVRGILNDQIAGGPSEVGPIH